MKIAVVSLIFKSLDYIKFTKRSFENAKGNLNAELWFIANDATDEILEELFHGNYKFLVHNNKLPYSNIENKMKNIYCAWNRAQEIECDILVLTNSDMWFSADCLENMIKKLTENKVITARLVESGKLPSGEWCLVKNFGMHPREFDQVGFEIFADSKKENILLKGGMYMPLAIMKENFIPYPEGNQWRENQWISGDKIMFENLKTNWVEHFTALDALCYHIQLGEDQE